MTCTCINEQIIDDYDIQIIQGDYSTFVYELLNENDTEIEQINNVIFSCPSLNLNKYLTKLNASEYLLAFFESDTKVISSGTYDYNLIVEFDEKIQSPITAVYRSKITILQRKAITNA